jgi:hypothetical protein
MQLHYALGRGRADAATVPGMAQRRVITGWGKTGRNTVIGTEADPTGNHEPTRSGG